MKIEIEEEQGVFDIQEFLTEKVSLELHEGQLVFSTALNDQHARKGMIDLHVARTTLDEFFAETKELMAFNHDGWGKTYLLMLLSLQKRIHEEIEKEFADTDEDGNFI